MKFFIMTFLSLAITFSTFAYEVTGTAYNSETGNPLSGFDILLTYTTGGIAGEALTQSDGSFTITGIENGSYHLEFYTYPDPLILDGDYFLRVIYKNIITIDGGNVNDINFEIPPHHPQFIVTGTLYDASTNQPLVNQDFELRLEMQYYIEIFDVYAGDDGTYEFENIPDWTYDFTLFDNDYYNGEMTEITIDPEGSDTIQMDFYLEAKMGATLSGVLLDSTTNQPIMQAGRHIKLQAINSLFAETNGLGEFTFPNVPPGIYSGIVVTSQDTDYVNCSGSEINGVIVPEEGLDNVQLYQKPWVSIHEVTADVNTFEPGETKTIKFSIVNDDLSYGSIWGVNLIFPEGVTVLNTTPFYSDDNSGVIFDELPDCSTDAIKAWEGWHWIGIPPYASSDGNLDNLNESAWSNVTVEFADSASMETAPIFYEIFYAEHCFNIQPFSYGTIMMLNGDILNNIGQVNEPENRIGCYPNPAENMITLNLVLDKARKGTIQLFDISGRSIKNLYGGYFKKGPTSTNIKLDDIEPGIYYYSFLSDDLKLTGKLIIAR